VNVWPDRVWVAPILLLGVIVQWQGSEVDLLEKYRVST